MEALFHLFKDTPRGGPGSDATTRDLLRRLPPLAPEATVFDLGCGPGKQTLVLARALQTRIIAVDIHQPFLDRLARSAAEAGLAGRVETRCRSMDDLAMPDESIDLIWSEGAVYILGVAAALSAWVPLLRPGGHLVFSDATWWTEDPPAEVAAYFAREYPAMATVAHNLETARQAGMEVVGTERLADRVWWTEFYEPLRARLPGLRAAAASWPELAQAIADSEHEMDLFRRFSDSFGYAFYL